MPEELLYQDKMPRPAYEKEKQLLLCLVKNIDGIVFDIKDIKVIEINDDGMGSLYIVHRYKEKAQRKMGKCIAERQFADEDDVPILVSLNVDEAGDLFELDVWRADFNPVIRYPSC